MIWSTASFLIGLAVLPALALVVLVVQAIVVETFRRVGSIECAHCDDWKTGRGSAWLSKRRLTVHVMKKHPRASLTYLTVYAGGTLPRRIAYRTVRAQNAASVGATLASRLVDIGALLPLGEPITDAIATKIISKPAGNVGWHDERRCPA